MTIHTALESDRDFQIFKRWVKGHLSYGPVTITFLKKDGTERVMQCTTNYDLVPKVEVRENLEPKKKRNPMTK